MDKQEIIRKIQELVKMSKSKSSEDTLKIELSSIVEEIKAIKAKLEVLNFNSDEQYYNEEERLRDKQLEVQCQKRIRQIKSDLEKLQKELDENKQEKEKLNDEISSITTSLSTKIIEKAKEKLEITNDQDAKEHYERIIASEQESINKGQEKKSELETKYEVVQNRIESLNKDIAEIEETLDFTQQNLAEIQSNLENTANYIDKNRRNLDEAKKQELEKQLMELETKQNEIITDPVMLASQAKAALLDGDLLTTLNKAKEIARQVLDLPYMDIENDENLANLEEDAIQERDQFYASIKSKKYNLSSNQPIEERIEFLKDCIKKWESEIEKYQELVAEIDKDAKYNVSEKIDNIINLINELELNIDEYNKNIISISSDNISKKMEFQAAVNRKEEELSVYKAILDGYKTTQLLGIEEATTLNNYATEIAEKITNANKEIENLENEELKFDSKSIDALAKEQDTVELKRLSDVVVAIKHRRQFNETPVSVISEMEKDLGFDITLGNEEEIISNEVETTTLDEGISEDEKVEFTSEDKVENVEVENVESEENNISYTPAFTEETPLEEEKQEAPLSEIKTDSLLIDQIEESEIDNSNESELTDENEAEEAEKISEQIEEVPVVNEEQNKTSEEIALEEDLNMINQQLNSTTEIQPIEPETKQEDTDLYSLFASSVTDETQKVINQEDVKVEQENDLSIEEPKISSEDEIQKTAMNAIDGTGNLDFGSFFNLMESINGENTQINDGEETLTYGKAA